DAVLSGTLPSPLGWFGIALAVAGTLSLSGRPDRGRLRALLGRRDALDALAAAILLGVLAAVDRWAAVVLGPPSYLARSHAGAAAVLTGVISAVTVRRGLVELATARNVLTIVAHGVLGVTGTAMQTNALTMAPASYVNAIRRLSAVVAVGLGRTLFGEPDLGRRLPPARRRGGRGGPRAAPPARV